MSSTFRGLKKLSLFVCDKGGGSSKGMREFIAKDLDIFLKNNPQLITEVVNRPGHHPFVLGEYSNGYKKQICVRSYTPKEIFQECVDLRNSLGLKAFKIGSGVVTSFPSIEGEYKWTMDPNIKVSGIDSLPDTNRKPQQQQQQQQQ